MENDSFNEVGFNNEVLEIYIQYEYLSANDVHFFLKEINSIYKIISKALITSERNDLDSCQYPFLEIESIHTGESIKLKMKNGWLPRIKKTKHNTYIELPKKLINKIIPMIIGSLISNGNININTNINLGFTELDTTTVQQIDRHAQKALKYFGKHKNIELVKVNDTTILKKQDL